ncbi:MAG TPA: energy transducer TonB [Candidatus Acidoferrum sp.]|nr:energy transducer TonB [Candidatus Acidoferrum sp.]
MKKPSLHYATLAAIVWLGQMLLLLSPAMSQVADPAPQTPENQANIESLSQRLIKLVQEKHLTKVIVFDLLGPAGLRAPYGSWLADELSARLIKLDPSLQIIDRASIRPVLDQRDEEAGQVLAGGEQEAQHVDQKYLKQEGADGYVFGRYSKLASGIGITLGVSDGVFVHHSPEISSLLPLDDHATSMLPPGLTTYFPKDGIYDADVGGVTAPVCLTCPAPTYDENSRKANCNGTVRLNVVITAQGTVTDISEARGIPGCPGLTQSFVKSASKWSLEPSHGPSGEPVALRVPVETAFALTNFKQSVCIKCRIPRMDFKSRKNHCQGVVAVEFDVAPDGKTANLSVTKEVPGCPGLTKAALDAVRKSTFQPGPTFEGNSLPKRRTMEYTFKLK